MANPSGVLPEDQVFVDGGCSLAPSCLDCPLPVCRYDVQGGARYLRNLGRDSEIRRLRSEEVPAKAIAKQMGLSHRTVFRVMTEADRTIPLTEVAA